MKIPKKSEDNRLRQIQKQILKYASGDFNFSGKVSNRGDKLDAIIGGLNMLGEEIRYFVSELEKTKKKVEESDKLKSNFLNNISHEIRTPASIIIGFVDILKESNIDIHERKLYLDLISENASNLLKSISDIVEISCLEANTVKISYSEIHLSSFLENILKEFKLNRKYQVRSFISLNVNKNCDNKICISSDKEKLSLIINKLIDNAFKYTNKGKIELAFHLKSEYIFFNVIDTGIGIDKNKHQVIFEKFRQGEENLTRQYEGVGLGLSISKALVELLEGEISVESEIGKGTCISFYIPYKPIKEDFVKTDKYEIKNISFNNIFEGKIILIAESEIYNFVIFKKYLEATNAKILHANNGLKALELCKKHRDIDIVLINTQLKDVDGIKIIRKIKRIRPELPIISHTSRHLPENRKKTLNAGCVDFLPIPINKKILLNKLNKYIYVK